MTGRYVSRKDLQTWGKTMRDLREEVAQLRKENARLRRNDRMKYLLRKEAVAGLDKAELRELTKLMIEGEEE